MPLPDESTSVEDFVTLVLLSATCTTEIVKTVAVGIKILDKLLVVLRQQNEHKAYLKFSVLRDILQETFENIALWSEDQDQDGEYGNT